MASHPYTVHPHGVFYAVKANSNLSILRLLAAAALVRRGATNHLGVILQVAPELSAGGVERTVLEVTEALVASGALQSPLSWI